jgi:phosphoglycolate phosphatase
VSKAYRLAMFDLDGTLSNSAPGIFYSLKETFPKVDWPVPGPETLRRFIGPPLWNCLQDLLGMPAATADQFVRFYRDSYNSEGFCRNELYPGIRDLLSDLRKAGILTAVVTSKPVTPAKAVLNYFKITDLFDFFSAENDSDHGGGKEALIRPVLLQSGIPASQAVMIGDTKYDAAGARRAGTEFLGVLYGFGTREEIEREGGTRFAQTVGDLGKILLAKNDS